MVDSTKSATEFLEQLRAEREELNGLIQALEKRLGISASHQPSETDAPKSSSRATASIDSIPVGFFHNLSQAAAAEKLLRLNPNHALTTNEILEAFRMAGMDASGKNAVT